MLSMKHTVESFAHQRQLSARDLLKAAEDIGIAKQSGADSLTNEEQNQLLLARTVRDFAARLDVSHAQLLGELEEIGLPKEGPDSYLSGEQQWQRERARPVATLAEETGIDVKSLVRKLEEEGRAEPSAGSLVTPDEWQRLVPFVIAKTIRALRDYRGLTRAEVAENAGMSERHLAKIEAGEILAGGEVAAERSRGQVLPEDHGLEALLEKLAPALNSTVKDLKGTTETARLARDATRSQKLVAISAKVTTEARTGFARIRDRYGWTIAHVMEVAPVLFVLLAEGSLARRRRHLRELQTKYDAVPQLQSFLADFRERRAREEASIQNHNLREDGLSDDGSADPFLTHLIELARAIQHAGVSLQGDADGYEPNPTSSDPDFERVSDEQALLRWLLRDDERCPACRQPLKPEHLHCPWCGRPRPEPRRDTTILDRPSEGKKHDQHRSPRR